MELGKRQVYYVPGLDLVKKETELVRADVASRSKIEQTCNNFQLCKISQFTFTASSPYEFRRNPFYSLYSRRRFPEKGRGRERELDDIADIRPKSIVVESSRCRYRENSRDRECSQFAGLRGRGLALRRKETHTPLRPAPQINGRAAAE